MTGYLFVYDRGEVEPVSVVDPKREFIEPGDLLLVQDYDGEIHQVTACSCITMTSYDGEDNEELMKIAKICGVRRPSKLVGTVINDLWYGKKEEPDEDEK